MNDLCRFERLHFSTQIEALERGTSFLDSPVCVTLLPLAWNVSSSNPTLFEVNLDYLRLRISSSSGVWNENGVYVNRHNHTNYRSHLMLLPSAPGQALDLNPTDRHRYRGRDAIEDCWEIITVLWGDLQLCWKIPLLNFTIFQIWITCRVAQIIVFWEIFYKLRFKHFIFIYTILGDLWWKTLSS